jgi:ribonucleoside-diphosphate reductase subunit M1
MKNRIIAYNGSVQNIPEIPRDVKAIYKTVWEISQKKVLDLAADRGAFICQSQSLNVHLQAPTPGQLTSMHFYGWKRGLKTGMYYLRTRPAAQAIQFTLDHNLVTETKKMQQQLVTPQSTPSKRSAAETVESPVVAPSPVVVAPAVASEPLARSMAAQDVSSSGESSPATPSLPTPSNTEDSLAMLDDKTRDAAEKDPEFAAALKRKRDSELEQAKLMCSLENKEACVMCSG